MGMYCNRTGERRVPEELEPQGSDVDLPQEPEAVCFSWALGLLARPRHGKSAYTFTIITTRANGLVRRLHDRMPVIYDAPRQWLRAAVRQPGAALDLVLQPLPSERMGAHEFRRLVNHWRTTRRLAFSLFHPAAKKVAVVAAHEALVFPPILTGPMLDRFLLHCSIEHKSGLPVADPRCAW